VVLVRHGQSTWNAESRIQGSSDLSVLTPKGESQAETSRQMLLSDSFDACFTSPLARSRRTAEIIWQGRDDDLIPDSDLREIDLYSFQVSIFVHSFFYHCLVCVALCWQGACRNAWPILSAC
jgi:probable phosphoglycerate mutase